MPSPRVCLAIVLFWLGFNGYLLYHDLLPRLLPGQPPPYTIDLVEEAQTRRPATDWSVLHDGEPAFRARTAVTNPEHDVFELTSEFTPLSNAPPVPLHQILVRRMSSRYRVNSAGDLLGLAVTIEGSPEAPLLRLVAKTFTVRIDGSVAGGELASRLKLELPDRGFDLKLPAVQTPPGGSVLLPLHPVNRLRGLRPGQTWTQHVFDPLEAALGAFQKTSVEPRLVRARVTEADVPFTWGRRRDVECLVVHYDGDGLKGSTWVGKERGQVLAQEVVLDHQRWVMYRD
jgi:hypothetical protein